MDRPLGRQPTKKAPPLGAALQLLPWSATLFVFASIAARSGTAGEHTLGPLTVRSARPCIGVPTAFPLWSPLPQPFEPEDVAWRALRDRHSFVRHGHASIASRAGITKGPTSFHKRLPA